MKTEQQPQVLGDMIYSRAKYAVSSVRGSEPRIVYADGAEHARTIYQRAVGLRPGTADKL